MPFPNTRRTRLIQNTTSENVKQDRLSSSSSSSSSSEEETHESQPGKIKNLTGFFAEQTDDAKNIKKKRFELIPADNPETIILENDPVERIEGVIKSTDPSEWQKPVEVEKGAIKNLANMFQNITTEQSQPKKPFKFDFDENIESTSLENEPTERLEGVIRSADPAEWQKPIDVERGATKNLAHMFQNINHSDHQASKKPFKLDIDENARTIVLESEPIVLEGVVRSVDKTEDVIGKRGRIKNLAGKFINPATLNSGSDEESSNKPMKTTEKTKGSRTVSEKWKQQQETMGSSLERKHKAKVELESAEEYGVYENEPEVRNDIVRANDDQPDVIFVQHTRNLRKMWCQFEKDEMAKDKNLKNIENIIRTKKKDPSPEPPPLPELPPPVNDSKSKRTWASKKAEKEINKNETQKHQTQQVEQPPAFQKPTLRSVAKKRF